MEMIAARLFFVYSKPKFECRASFMGSSALFIFSLKLKRRMIVAHHSPCFFIIYLIAAQSPDEDTTRSVQAAKISCTLRLFLVLKGIFFVNTCVFFTSYVIFSFKLSSSSFFIISQSSVVLVRETCSAGITSTTVSSTRERRNG